MSEQRRAIAKLFPEKGEIAMGYHAGPPPSISELSSVPPSQVLKRILSTNIDEILAEYDQSMLDDWDRRFEESNRINSELGDLDKDSYECLSEINCQNFQDSAVCG